MKIKEKKHESNTLIWRNPFIFQRRNLTWLSSSRQRTHVLGTIAHVDRFHGPSLTLRFTKNLGRTYYHCWSWPTCVQRHELVPPLESSAFQSPHDYYPYSSVTDLLFDWSVFPQIPPVLSELAETGGSSYFAITLSRYLFHRSSLNLHTIPRGWSSCYSCFSVTVRQ